MKHEKPAGSGNGRNPTPPPAATAATVTMAMVAAADPIRAEGMRRFFKTGPGQYGEGDVFLGLSNPEMRRFARDYRDLALAEAVALLHRPYHEVRACGLQILVRQYARGDEARREVIYRHYLDNVARINNWDLVDLSAPDIVGTHLLTRDRAVLYELAASTHLWSRRIAILATLTFLRDGDFTDTLKLAELLLADRHDLMHKAIGWMLREVGKRDRAVLTDFLIRHKETMPRTALRYAIEHYSESERQDFLKRDRK